MWLQGTQFLVYTIDMGDLLLNAVALEFVISTDELLFESLAPVRTKRILENIKPFMLSPWKVRYTAVTCSARGRSVTPPLHRRYTTTVTRKFRNGLDPSSRCDTAVTRP